MFNSMVIPVTDLDVAKAVYGALAGEPHTDTPYYVGYNVDGFEIALAPGDDSVGVPVLYADVPDLDAAREKLIAAGATEKLAPKQVAAGVRICVLVDADGNLIGIRG
ncbi:VOC family protein [Nocardioides alcanivorans]|uniref:VOC family protein n=1 Tax=Nocardioides alcanivorans TaxID=2897352 RepID=UPI001F3E321A|nr:glyoxalase [Nocardioides alcanivorans]